MIPLKSLEFLLPTKIIFGIDVSDRAGEISKEYADKAILVTSGKVMRKAGILEKIESVLRKSQIEYILFDHVDRDPSNDVIDEIGALIKQSKVKLVIAFGGTSVINAAKAGAYLGRNDGKIVEYLNGELGKDEAVPVITIPTIPGVLQVTNDEFILKDTNDNLKKIFKNPSLYPAVTLLDPKLTISLPINYTIGSCYAILSNAIESYISGLSNPISDSLSRDAIEIIGNNIKQVFQQKDDLTARSNIMMAGLLQGMSLLTSVPGACEAMALALSSKDRIYKNIAHAIMLPHVMEFNLTAVPNKYVSIAKALGEDVSNVTVVEAAIKAIEGVRKSLFDLKVPQKLSDYKVNKENLPVIASAARRYKFMNYTPLPISKEDILNVLLTAY